MNYSVKENSTTKKLLQKSGVFLFTLLLSILFSFTAFSQNELTGKLETINPSPSINDGIVVAKIQGGTPPYRYYWSNAGTPIVADTCKGNTEGAAVSLTVKDANDQEAKFSATVEPESGGENLNATFTPLVGAMATVLFFDPFAAIGIYDPKIKIKEGKIKPPYVMDKSLTQITVKKWLVEDKAKVKKGDMIATVTSNKDDREIYAQFDGTVNIVLKEGMTVYDVNQNKDARDVVRTNGGALGTIDYDQEQPLLNPNGTPQTKSIPLVVFWLVLGATFFTIKMNFINFRGFKHAIDLVSGKFDDPSHDHGEVSHFQALTTALSATVGLGNIASVAIAISVGGPGATFWMITAGLLGMSSKFVECTLGVKYRIIDKEGTVFGGPMYYLSQGLAKKRMGTLGKILAVVFAVLCVGGSFGGGNMFQVNQAFDQLQGQIPALAGNGVWFGIGFAVIVGVVIIGGIKSIAKVTDKIVPFMCGIYVLAALTVIVINIESVGDALMLIFDGAFNAEAAAGGFIGVLIQGFRRAAFSNEAGVGSASIAHSAAKTDEPVSEGIVALLEPFIDTVIVCTMTALVIIFTGEYANQEGLSGALLTSRAFGKSIPWFPYVLTVAIVLFAFSTMVSWSYYGERAWSYLFGQGKIASLVYKGIFLIFVVIGASIELGAVVDFSDMMILGMAFPNILGLILLSPEVRKDLRTYFNKVKSGEIKKFK
ncbi:amino acid carrier protein [Bernardetia sp.]|uniref:amino acid carrier protein n=1 Tax=Bernardetia sp. TaxID=1937974 RepID=UPI0025BA62FB|nr:amino acid carrier protein [Bernardetia sp.]